MIRQLGLLFLVICICSPAICHAAEEPGLRQLVEADWAAQEKRLKRVDDSPDAIIAAADRASKLFDDLRAVIDISRELTQLDALRERVKRIDTLDSPDRRALYRDIRWFAQPRPPQPAPCRQAHRLHAAQAALSARCSTNTSATTTAISRAAASTSSKIPASPSRVRDLLQARLPEGNFTTLALSYDAKTLYFAFAEKAAPKPDFYSPQPGAASSTSTRWTSTAPTSASSPTGNATTSIPVPLPDGGIAFMSTRRGAASSAAHNPWEPIPAYTLHRMDADGKNIRTLSFHETNEWHPSVLNDGRIVYIRWDYVDRSAANFHGLWVSNPDGSNPAILFGNYTDAHQRLLSAPGDPRLQPHSLRRRRASRRRRRLAGDPRSRPRRASIAQAARMSLPAVERLTPEVCFPEAARAGRKSYFHSPWPLSENYFLVSFSFDPLPGMGPAARRDITGLYYFDRFGNLELLYRDRGHRLHVPDSPRAAPGPAGHRQHPRSAARR